MKRSEGETPVVFRAWPDGTVIALFPTLAADAGGNECDSYEHFGQHGAAGYDGVVRQTRPARPEEYAALKAELEGDPYFYSLRVYLREPRGAFLDRLDGVRRGEGRRVDE